MIYRIKRITYGIGNRLVKMMKRGEAGFAISDSSRVNYLGIRHCRDNRLSIAERSIVEGNIIFEKDGASVCIGKETYIGRSNIICAEAIDIGDHVLIAWGCTIIDHNSHALSPGKRAKDVADWYRNEKDWSEVMKNPVAIGHHAWIGFNSIILKGVRIGEGAVVGAGSVVAKDVEPYTVVAGNPARVVRKMKDATAT